MGLTDAELARLSRNIDYLDPLQKERVLLLLEERERVRRIEEARTRFLAFVKMMWPDVVLGAHHTIMAEAFEEMVFGSANRLLINIAPRHTKSEFASWLLPLWFLGQRPTAKIMQCMNTQDLAAGFGRRVRNTISKEAIATELKGFDPYHEIFPDMDLAKDSGAASHWHNTAGGEYYGVGTGGKIAGRGADLLLIDDPHALEINTEIPTPNGFTRIADLQVGDEVFGPDGLPTKVVSKSDVWYERELYAVTTDDRQTILCDAAHLWSYRSDTKLTAPQYIAATRDLVDWRKQAKPCLPRHQPVQYPRVVLPIDPWVLGAWLGDGTSSLGRMTAHPDDQPYMRAQFTAAGYEVTELADEFSFGVKGLRAQLIEQGLLNNKHVPNAYLLASIDQRMALLQGLMDTDGNVTEAGQCAFHNSNRGLVEAVIELLHSLGVKAKLSQYEDTRGRWKSAKTKFRVTFKLKNAARMPRKAVRTFTPTDKRCRSISVSKTSSSGAVQCITVERPDGLFLAGRGYVVTHNSEQEAKLAESSPDIFDQVYDWYVYGPRQRLQPGARIVVIQTRWSKRDLTGRLIRKMQEDDSAVADRWKVIEFPAILDEGQPTERSLWPQYWPLQTLQATRAALPVSAWQSQYQQNPTSESAAIFKRENWRRWGSDKEQCPGPRHVKAWENLEPPACDYIIASWDAAATKNDRSHPSAYTLWGVFKAEDPVSGKDVNHVILLSSFTGRMEFPELKKKAKQFYDEDNPDTLLIENKSAGMQLLQEFQSMGIPAESFTGSSRGTKKMPNDKIARANMVSDIFASRYVWAPERRFADVLIEQMADFPNGSEDDLVDSTVQAMLRFREGGMIRTANDDTDDENVPRRRGRRYY